MMDPIATSSNSPIAGWLIFTLILLGIGIVVACFTVWLFGFHQPGKKHHKRRKRRRHHREVRPTLAQTGGLPPPRGPNEPPRGA
jgi:hypothetical protein